MAGVLDVWKARGTSRLSVVGDRIAVDGQVVPRSRGFGADLFSSVGAATIPIARAGMAVAIGSAVSNIGERPVRGSNNFLSSSGLPQTTSRFDAGGILDELLDIGGDWVRGKLGGSEGPTSQPTVPSSGAQVTPGLVPSGDCPGLTSVRIGGVCVDLGALPPGGKPAVTGQTQTPTGADGYGPAVKGWYGVGLTPRVEMVTARRCPRGMALGKDGVCYDRTRLRKSDREWVPPRKPLLTGGDRAAIAKAAAAGRKLERAQKSLKRASKALGKAC
jgi:hypothetical protein